MRYALIPFLILDFLACALAFEGTATAVRAVLHPDAALGIGTTGLVAWSGILTAVISAYAAGLHDRDVLLSPRALVSRAGFVGVLMSLAVLLSSYFILYAPVGRVSLVLLAFLSTGAVLSWRLVYSRIEASGGRLPVVVYGAGQAAREFAETVNASRHLRHVVVGFLEDTLDDRAPDPDGLPVLGTTEDPGEALHEFGGRNLVVALDRNVDDADVSRLAELRGHGVHVGSAPEVAMDLTRRVPLSCVQGQWVLAGLQAADRPGAPQIKRIVDVLLACFGLLLFGVMLPVLYPLVVFTSPGGFFYVQERVGLGGRRFMLFKVRTMTKAKDSSESWTTHGDARVTGVGGLLRRTRIDELPQFLNVLRGDMSIVGPRPEQPGMTQRLAAEIPHFEHRLLVKPGITGWAQIHQGYAASVEGSAVKLSHDLYYVRRQSFGLDLDIMIRTAFVMLARIGSR